MKALLLATAANALVQIPFLMLFAWLSAKAVRRWPAVWQVWLWRTVMLGAIVLPLASARFETAAHTSFRVTTNSAGAASITTASKVFLADSNAFHYMWLVYLAVTIFLAARLLLRLLLLLRLTEERVSVPLTFGFLRQRILLPVVFSRDATAEARQVAIAHESAHVAHHDFAWNFALELLTLPVGFHPLLGWVKRQMRAAVELRCDEVAANAVGGNRRYSAGLLAAAELLQSGPALASASTPLAATLFDDDLLERRIVNLMEPKTQPSRLARLMATTGLAFGLALAGYTATQFSLSAQQEQTYSIQDAGVKAPKLLHKVEPDYTDTARDKKISGVSVLQVTVSSKGKISEASVKRSLEESLDQKAIEAVRKWDFQPATKDGQPVAVRATIEVNFRLE